MIGGIFVSVAALQVMSITQRVNVAFLAQKRCIIAAMG